MSQADSQEVITAFIDSIRPNFNYVVGTVALSGCLLTLLIVLFAFSTKETRRRPVYYLNVLAIYLALTLSIFTGITSGTAILDPFHLVPKDVYLATITFAVFPPLFYDSILLFRLFALYPPSTTPKNVLLKIFAFPFFIKCARIVFISLCLNDIAKAATTTAALIQYAEDTRPNNPYMIAEWSLQIADNLYSVTFFLYKLHGRTSNIKRASGLTDRLCQIFYISVANFVFPLLFNIAQIICVIVSQSSSVTMLMLVNNYVPVIGILCATIWFSGTDWHPGSDPSAEMVHPERTGSGRHQLPDGQNENAPRFIVDLNLRGTNSSSRLAMHSKQVSTLPHDDDNGPYAFRHFP